MKMKGQILVFEQVLIFTMGIAILMVSLSLFMLYQNYYGSSSDNDQMIELKEYVISSIIRISEEKDTNSSVMLSIPKRIGNNLYKISLSNAGLNITVDNEKKTSDFSPIYSLNKTYTMSGMATSDLGKIVLYKNGNSIVLDRR
jgi:predicted hydrocarbon binding protein